MNQEFTDKDFSSLQKLASVATDDVKSLQQQIRDNPRTIIDEDPPVIEPAKPQDNAGRISAEEVQAQYAAAAQAIKDMSAAVRDRIKQLDHALRECDKDMRLLAEVAQVIRDKKGANPMTKETKTTEETYGAPDDWKVDPRKVEAYREGQERRHRGQGQ